MRVLLLAEACNPDWTSVPLVGWNWATSLAREVEVTLVTQVRNREAIERAKPKFPLVFIDNEWIAAPLYRLGVRLRGGESLGYATAMAASYLPYLDFERRVWRELGDAVRSRRYDLVHRVTPVSPILPSPLARYCREARVPFVLGPLNGGLPWSESHPDLQRAEREWLYPLRSLARHLPFYKATFGPGTFPVAASRNTLDEIRRISRECAYIPENGIDPERFNPPQSFAIPTESPLIITWTGRMVPCKAGDLVLEALARIADEVPFQLHLIGDGPERCAWEGLAKELGIAPRVRFHGWVDQERVAETLRGSHMFCFPSLREFGGASVTEAMGCGAAPVVVEFGGPAEIVDARSGIRVPMGSRHEIIGALADAIRDLNLDRPRLQLLRKEAAERALKFFSWRNKASAMRRLYQSVIESHTTGKAWNPEEFPPMELGKTVQEPE